MPGCIMSRYLCMSLYLSLYFFFSPVFLCLSLSVSLSLSLSLSIYIYIYIYICIHMYVSHFFISLFLSVSLLLHLSPFTPRSPPPLLSSLLPKLSFFLYLSLFFNYPYFSFSPHSLLCQKKFLIAPVVILSIKLMLFSFILTDRNEFDAAVYQINVQ